MTRMMVFDQRDSSAAQSAADVQQLAVTNFDARHYSCDLSVTAGRHVSLAIDQFHGLDISRVITVN